MTGIRRLDDGSLSITISENEFIALGRLEADLLATLSDRLSGLAGGETRTDRLFPDAYHDDTEANAEFHALTDVDLVTAKGDAARGVMSAFLEAEEEASGSLWKHAATRTATFGPDDAVRLLRNLTDLRIIVADRLGIERDGDDGANGDPADRMVYWWLGETQERLVESMSTPD
jgi:hypothetical protein